jgi:hypothetical protein
MACPPSCQSNITTNYGLKLPKLELKEIFPSSKLIISGTLWLTPMPATAVPCVFSTGTHATCPHQHIELISHYVK